MRPFGSRPLVTGVLLTASVLVIDQVSKVAANTHAATVLPARNHDYAFGIIGGSAPVLVIGALLVLGVFLGLASMLVLRMGISVSLPALVAGGTIGNTLDRMRLGSVRDFLVTPWAIINLADVAVAIGTLGIAIAIATRVPRMRAELTSGYATSPAHAGQ